MPIFWLDGLIRRKTTGTAEEVAKKIGISRSMLMFKLNEREMGALIKFCPIRKIYCYEQKFDLLVGNMIQVKGGNTAGINITYLNFESKYILAQILVLYKAIKFGLHHFFRNSYGRILNNFIGHII